MNEYEQYLLLQQIEQERRRQKKKNKSFLQKAKEFGGDTLEGLGSIYDAGSYVANLIKGVSSPTIHGLYSPSAVSQPDMISQMMR